MLTNPCDAMLYIYIYTYTYTYNRETDGARPSYCVFSISKKAAIRHLGFSYFRIFVWKIQICAYIVVMQNLVKIGLSAAKLLRIFYFQNGGRPPSWIWYDVIADHPRLVFYGPNILIKMHVHRFTILWVIAIFRLDALALSVIATATCLGGWLAGWLGGCLSQPVLYQND